MNDNDTGRVQAPGSREPSPDGLGPSGFDPSRMFWVELREPGCVPQRKGPFPRQRIKGFVRECMEFRPTAYITVITWSDHSGPSLSDGPEWLMMADMRSRSTCLAHIRRTRAAHSDSDRSGEAGETGNTGSTEGESAGLQGIAQDPQS